MSCSVSSWGSGSTRSSHPARTSMRWARPSRPGRARPPSMGLLRQPSVGPRPLRGALSLPPGVRTARPRVAGRWSSPDRRGGAATGLPARRARGRRPRRRASSALGRPFAGADHHRSTKSGDQPADQLFVAFVLDLYQEGAAGQRLLALPQAHELLALLDPARQVGGPHQVQRAASTPGRVCGHTVPVALVTTHQPQGCALGGSPQKSNSSAAAARWARGSTWWVVTGTTYGSRRWSSWSIPSSPWRIRSSSCSWAAVSGIPTGFSNRQVRSGAPDDSALQCGSGSIDSASAKVG